MACLAPLTQILRGKTGTNVTSKKLVSRGDTILMFNNFFPTVQPTLWVGGRRVVGNFHWVYSTDTATPENRGPRISLSKDYWHTHEPNNYSKYVNLIE